MEAPIALYERKKDRFIPILMWVLIAIVAGYQFYEMYIN